MIRVVLPLPLRSLARADRELQIIFEGPPTIGSVLDAVEARYPVLRGTIRDQITKQRRPFIRFFASGQDISLVPQDAPLPEAVVSGMEPLRIIGAIAGG
jgi:molybdopterin synthase sulfur carrier subunit